MNIHTADLCDAYEDQLSICAPMFRSYGGRRACGGPISTLKLYEDNSLVRQAVEEPGHGRVLVVDGGGSMRRALVGDQLAALAVRNGWAGIIVYGCIRDSQAISEMDLAVFALATHPLKTVKRQSGERDVVLNFGGIHFTPGHHVYADEDGVIVAAQALQA